MEYDVQQEKQLLSPTMIDKEWLVMSKKQKIEDDYLFNLKTDNLGHGSFGTVVKAIKKCTNQVRAIKMINKKRIRYKERLFNEIETMSTLDHPNILKLYETYENETYIYLVIEYCKGGDLLDRLIQEENNKGFAEQIAQNYFKQIISAVAYCHDRKFAHRDLKLDNCMFTINDKDALLKVIDFGLSKQYDKNSLQILRDQKSPKLKNKNMLSAKILMKTILGTPIYMPPEIVEGKQYTEKCDVWSSGIILYILLCGVPPFLGNSDKETLEKVKEGVFDLNGDEWKNISNVCKDLISKMLTKEEIRIDAKDILKHPWLQQTIPNQVENIIPIVTLRRWAKYSKMKRLAIKYICGQLGEELLQKYIKIFISLDMDCDGYLNQQELKAALRYDDDQEQQQMEAKDREYQDIFVLFKTLDTNQQNHITYTDFLSCLLDPQQYTNEQALIKEAFNIFDRGNTGFISPQQLKEIFIENTYYKSKDQRYWQQMVNQIDYKKDGIIDFEEFKQMLLNQQI